jgi:outer membrane protein assembly factor BamB
MIRTKTLIAATLVVLLSALTLPAQHSRARVYTRPVPPPAEMLRRLNLTQAWSRYVPTEGTRDGIATVQIDGRDLLLQTHRGLVLRLDAETGEIRWRTLVGIPYRVTQPLAMNSRLVLVVNNATLYGLDRDNGALLWRFRLPGGIAAPPVADELLVYVSTATTRLYTYALPRAALPESVPGGPTGTPPGKSPPEGPALSRSPSTPSPYARTLLEAAGASAERVPVPTPLWDELTDHALQFAPLLSTDTVLVTSPDGTSVAFTKARAAREGAGSVEVYQFKSGKVAASPGRFGDTAYIPSQDSNLYALNIGNGRLRWRYTAGSPLARRPSPLERDVYVTAERDGLTRVDRETGEALWRVPHGRLVRESNPEADRFLAANNKFVYAADRTGRLMVLERRRGITLSTYDTRALNVVVPNEVTDRLYLAANNGLIVCLHDRDYLRPLRHRRLEEEASSPVKKTLATPVSLPPAKAAPLREVLNSLRTKYGLKFTIAERAFKEAGLEDAAKRPVTIPRLEKRPLGEVLQRILDQIKATYQVVDDTILIVPGPPRKE